MDTTIKAAEDALLGAVHFGFGATNGGAKNSFFNFVERALTDLVIKGAFDDILERKTEK